MKIIVHIQAIDTPVYMVNAVCCYINSLIHESLRTGAMIIYAPNLLLCTPRKEKGV